MFRIGQGYDIHKLAKGKDLILCGEKIPHSKGLIGHSDADVAVHAIIDSLLGAACLRDIGFNFKDTDPLYKDINSLILLEKTLNLLKTNKFKPINLDLTIIAQEPKLTPFYDKMQSNLQNILKIDAINIKFKTNEQQDSLGNCFAIASLAICLLKKI